MLRTKFGNKHVASNLPNTLRGSRGVTTVKSTHGTLYGPFYRKEGFGAKGDNTKTIVKEKRLLEGKGIGGRSDGVYAFTNWNRKELKEAENDWNPTIVFFTKTMGTPGINMNGDTMKWDTDELDIEVAAVLGKENTDVLQSDLWAEAVGDAEKQE
jgi:hypothetical protein